jgi:hypothetical protein
VLDFLEIYPRLCHTFVRVLLSGLWIMFYYFHIFLFSWRNPVKLNFLNPKMLFTRRVFLLFLGDENSQTQTHKILWPISADPKEDFFPDLFYFLFFSIKRVCCSLFLSWGFGAQLEHNWSDLKIFLFFGGCGKEGCFAVLLFATNWKNKQKLVFWYVFLRKGSDVMQYIVGIIK